MRPERMLASLHVRTMQPREGGKTLEEAGWTLHFHDARGTAATRFYLARDSQGEKVFTIEEIAEILAWSVKKVEGIIKRYVTKDALLRDKIRRMNGTPDEQPL